MTCQSGAITPKVGGALTPEIHIIALHITSSTGGYDFNQWMALISQMILLSVSLSALLFQAWLKSFRARDD